MPLGNWYIPEGKLQKDLTDLIPGEDTILYTSVVYVELKDEAIGPILKLGELAITNRGIAFFAKRKGLKGGVLGFRGGPFREYIRYDQIEKIDSKGERVEILVSPDIDSPEEKPRRFELLVMQSEPFEDKKSFAKRRKSFSAVLEHAMYRYRSGQAQPDTVGKRKPPTRRASKTALKRQRRRVQYCPKCGTFLEEPAAFCENCGAPLKQK
jgi:hypothetical protein